MLEAFDHSLVEFENILAEGIPEMSLKSYRQLFNMHWGSRSIAYHGNPLDGLQIMGLLETRGLDFKRIICLGMNEGNLASNESNADDDSNGFTSLSWAAFTTRETRVVRASLLPIDACLRGIVRDVFQR